jgi:hypothetical protein
MNFHESTRALARSQVEHKIKDAHSRHTRQHVSHRHLSGGLLREHFPYAQKILKARAEQLAANVLYTCCLCNFDIIIQKHTLLGQPLSGKRGLKPSNGPLRKIEFQHVQRHDGCWVACRSLESIEFVMF